MKELYSEFVQFNNKYVRFLIVVLVIFYLSFHPHLLDGTFVYRDIVRLDYDAVLWALVVYALGTLYKVIIEVFPANYGPAVSGIYSFTVQYDREGIINALSSLPPSNLSSLPHLKFITPRDFDWERKRHAELNWADESISEKNKLFSDLSRLETRLAFVLSVVRNGGTQSYSISGFGFVNDRVSGVPGLPELYRSLIMIESDQKENRTIINGLSGRLRAIFKGHDFAIRIRQVSHQPSSSNEDTSIWFMIHMKMKFSPPQGFYVHNAALTYSNIINKNDTVCTGVINDVRIVKDVTTIGALVQF